VQSLEQVIDETWRANSSRLRHSISYFATFFLGKRTFDELCLIDRPELRRGIWRAFVADCRRRLACLASTFAVVSGLLLQESTGIFEPFFDVQRRAFSALAAWRSVGERAAERELDLEHLARGILAHLLLDRVLRRVLRWLPVRVPRAGRRHLPPGECSDIGESFVS